MAMIKMKLEVDEPKVKVTVVVEAVIDTSIAVPSEIAANGEPAIDEYHKTLTMGLIQDKILAIASAQHRDAKV